MEAHEINRFNNESWKYFGLLFRSAKLRLTSSPIIETIGVSMAVLLLWLGGSEVIIGSALSSEDFLRFMFLLFSMLGPIRSLSNVHITLQNGYASAERIFDILDEKTDVTDSGNYEIKHLNEGLKFENVSYNYGEGLSREHAAMEPRHLGVKAVIVKSFARIHETNLKKQGMLALTFDNESDYDKIQEDDLFNFVDLTKFRKDEQLSLELVHSSGDKEIIKLNHTFNNQQIEWFKNGSALNLIKSNE